MTNLKMHHTNLIWIDSILSHVFRIAIIVQLVAHIRGSLTEDQNCLETTWQDWGCCWSTYSLVLLAGRMIYIRSRIFPPPFPFLLPLLGMNRHDHFWWDTLCHISWKKRYVYEMNHSSLGRSITLRSKAKRGQLVHFTTPLSQISVELWLFGGLKPRKNMFETFRKASNTFDLCCP